MSDRLEGKIAVVTGGSRGIGEAIALAFAREGARLVIASRKQEQLDQAAERINEACGRDAVRARACHTGDPDQISDLIGWTEAELGLPEVLVNNAATNPYFGPLIDAPMPAWDKTFEVNLKGYFYISRLLAKRLLAAKRPGSIINVTSVLGQVAAPLQGVYGMTKAAVISMTRTLALELGKAGIRVNALAPGLVNTRLAAALINNPELTRFFTDRAPLGRYAEPEEITGAAVFLASEESAYVTGQTLALDGGFTIT
jgi:NAD(P)-dependent dehydrogenase (short-subunit alcohol dehydrogenase family)